MRSLRKESSKPVELLIPRHALAIKASDARIKMEEVRELGFAIKAAKLEGYAQAIEDILVEHGKNVYTPINPEVKLNARLKYHKQCKKSMPKG